MPVWRFLPLLCLAWAMLTAPAAAAEILTLSHMDSDPLSTEVFVVLREAYRRLDIDLRSKLLPRERALAFSDSGETDGEVIRIAGLEQRYPNLVPVPEPLFTFDAVAFTTGIRFEVNGWESLRPYSLCILRGMKLAETGTEGMQRINANGNEQAVRMLLAGRCQVAVLGHQIWRDVPPELVNVLQALEPPIASVPLFHYLHRGKAHLVPQVTQVLRQMREDGTTARLLNPSGAP